jgi:hypothetical protein
MLAYLRLARDDVHFAATVTRISGGINDDAFASIVRCANNLARRGARFVVVYPAVAASYWKLNRQSIQEVAARMPAQWALTAPGEWVFPDKLFCVTPYHLNLKGRALRTARLAAAVARARGWE